VKIGWLAITFLIALGAIYWGQYILNYYIEGEYTEGNLVANLNLIVNVGEPIYIKELRFQFLWPGETGNVYVILENYAPIDYRVSLKNTGVLAPKKDAIHISFDPITEVIPAKSQKLISIPISVESSAPIGVYELVIAVYRGGEVGNGLLITELHLVSYVGGEPLRVISVTLPSLWPGTSSEIIIEIENVADLGYNASISVEEVTAPSGDGLDVNLETGVFQVGPLEKRTIVVPVYLSDTAPVGTYTIRAKINRL
jgi:hypothetical protein